jgi:hypothetical protein
MGALNRTLSKRIRTLWKKRLSSSDRLGKIFSMNWDDSKQKSETPSRIGRESSLIRTGWKSESYQPEFFSYRADFFTKLIRTSRKKTGLKRVQKWINTLLFKHLKDLNASTGSISAQARHNRTQRKRKSYLPDFFAEEIRTSWKSFRTGKKGAPEFIQEIRIFGALIYTFLFISQEEVRDGSLKH